MALAGRNFQVFEAGTSSSNRVYHPSGRWFEVWVCVRRCILRWSLGEVIQEVLFKYVFDNRWISLAVDQPMLIRRNLRIPGTKNVEDHSINLANDPHDVAIIAVDWAKDQQSVMIEWANLTDAVIGSGELKTFPRSAGQRERDISARQGCDRNYTRRNRHRPIGVAA